MMKPKPALKYHRHEFDPLSLNSENIDRQVVELIPEGSAVLELGCATGFMGSWLRENKGCTVIGIENAPAERKLAKKVLDQVYDLDLSDAKQLQKFVNSFGKNSTPRKVDVILATSVLEHLVDPASTIQILSKLLTKKGSWIATTPNIAHWSTRAMLLSGRFEYQKYGIMDTTHLRFFTYRSFQELFLSQGLRIDHLSIDAEGGGFGRICIPLSKIWPNLFGYQTLVRATRA